jgi:hypothetical protein
MITHPSTWLQKKLIFISEIELSEQEEKEALLEGRKKKYFHEKHKDYWQALEKGKTETTKEIKQVLKSRL